MNFSKQAHLPFDSMQDQVSRKAMDTFQDNPTSIP
jgi:hypothetical protein